MTAEWRRRFLRALDALVPQLLDFLPALLLAAVGNVGAGELADPGDLKAAGEDGRRDPSR
ncbi:hypothetical protein GCM10010377_55670 [Streptomyces viridiviolaceus]|uniref:Uncharacterized protein n=1 Tax=Streptomyces viridiviolaceus TaxID=68282 RepID=A0ABW2E2Q7_9ACTN|nr:hypothetical protein [Streptomyces viridiviolaceus]GHB57480.1 hypothetical protein GCM10010377_55670 [Streptomyces viridiviolaceus]